MRKYNSILRFGKTGTLESVKDKEVYITEKLDGANASFRREGNKLKVFSRNQELNEHNTLRGFYGWVKDNVAIDLLAEGFTYYGEWLVQHTIIYKPEAYNNFYLFDVYDTTADKYLDFSLVCVEAGFIGLKTVDLLYCGQLNDISEAQKYVGKSNLAIAEGEGVVVKNYDNDSTHNLPNFVKIVSEKFQETKGVKVKKPAPNGDIDNFIDAVLTKARIEKLIHKKIDLGLLENELNITDTGTVIKAIGSDIAEDILKEEIDVLVKMLNGKIGKKSPVIIREILKDFNKNMTSEVQ